MKDFLGTILFLAIIIGAIYFITGSLGKDFDNRKNEYKKLVGEKVVVDKDTLLITDYSLILGKFYLNNGTEISKEYAEKKVVKPAAK